MVTYQQELEKKLKQKTEQKKQFFSKKKTKKTNYIPGEPKETNKVI